MDSRIGYGAVVLMACMAGFPATRPVAAQPDTTVAAHSFAPRAVLWRAAVPGWGQLRNRQYYKAAIVWGGLAGFTGAIIHTNRRYRTYGHGYLWVIRDISTANVPASYEQDYLSLLNELGVSPEEAASDAFQNRLSGLFRQQRNALRRNRDMLYIGTGVFYGLSILDAYVHAHLLGFDVGENLAFSLQPAGISATWRFRRRNATAEPTQDPGCEPVKKPCGY